MGHLGFTGTSSTVTVLAKHALKNVLQNMHNAGYLRMHNGDCIQADAIAARLWQEMGGKVVLHPPEDPKKRAFIEADYYFDPRPYLERNKDIVNLSRTLIAVSHGMTEDARSGTWATIRYAKKMCRPCQIILPNGEIQFWKPPAVDDSLG